MKALKEKRISLRSLWRRGLVILSLFALILAVGCSDSDESGTDEGGGGGGGGSGGSSGKTIVGMSILDRPACESEIQYEGFPIKLDGIKVLVRYNDNSTAEITDTSKLYVDPPFYQNKEYPGGYDVYLTNSEFINWMGNAPLSFVAKGIRNVTEFHWTGSVAKKTYFSDDIPNLSGLSLEMRYEDGDHANLYHKVLPLPKDWQYWEFSQREDRDEPFIAIYFPRSGLGAPVTPVSFIPLDKIYYVEKVEFDPAPAFADPIFVFDANVFGTGATTTAPANVTPALQAAWLNRIRDAKVKISYTDTTETRTYTIPEIDTMRYYTWSEGTNAWESNPVLELMIVPGEPKQNPAVMNAVDNKKGTSIKFRYRGTALTDALPVPIYGQFINITAVAKDGVDVVYDLRGTGDWPDGLYQDSIVTLASKIDVTANYALYTDKSVIAPKTLAFDNGDPTLSGWTRKPGIGVDGVSYGINLAGAIGNPPDPATSTIGIPMPQTLPGSRQTVWIADNITELNLTKDAIKKVQVTFGLNPLVAGNAKPTTIPVSFIKVKQY